MNNLSRISLATVLLPLLSFASATADPSTTLGTSVASTGANVQECPLFGKDIKRGASGDNVRRLQQFLARDPGVYPEGIVSGTYGSLTEAAVKRWQAKFNIINSGTPASTGFGVAGPRTIVAMISQCQGSTQISVSAAPSVGGLMKASPISGKVPLLVTVQVALNTANVCGGGIYTIDYGDNTIPYHISVPANQCQQVTYSVSHTYQNTGSFLLSLSIGLHKTSVTVDVLPK